MEAPALQWHIHPDVWLLMLGLIGGYVVLTRRWGAVDAPNPAHPVPVRKQASFFLGIGLMWLVSDWPIHEIAEDYLLSVHMVQHLVYTLVAPPLILMGFPKWFLRRLLAPKWLNKVVRAVTRPLIALIVFNAVIAISHWPALVDLALRYELVHFAVHVVLVATALAMWWPVVAPLPEFPRLSDPGKMIYLFGQSILPTVPASFLTFADAPIYTFYENAPRLWGISVVGDQQVAGLIMKIGGGLLLWSVIAVLFFKWSAKEEAQTSEELAWEDFEAELHAHNMRK
jgi:putative membrane protein